MIKQNCSFCGKCLTDDSGHTEAAVFIKDKEGDVLCCKTCSDLSFRMFMRLIQSMFGKDVV